jgi:hypothetical protein
MNRPKIAFPKLRNLSLRATIFVLLLGLLVYSLLAYTKGVAEQQTTEANSDVKKTLSKIEKDFQTFNTRALTSIEKMQDTLKAIQDGMNNIQSRMEEIEKKLGDINPKEPIGKTKNNNKVPGISMSTSSLLVILAFFLLLFGGISVVNWWLWGKEVLAQKVANRLRDILNQVVPQKIYVNQIETIPKTGVQPTITTPPEMPEQKEKDLRKEEFEREERERKPPTRGEMIGLSAQRYNEALSSNKEKRDKFLEMYEHIKVGIVESEEVQKGEYMAWDFMPTLKENPQGDFYLIKITDEHDKHNVIAILLYPNFYLDRYHWYNVKACFDLDTESNEVISQQKFMIQEVKKPALCEKESTGIWRLKQKGKVVIRS